MTGQVRHFDYAIVGGGCIGASTALAVQKEWPDAKIIWFEGTDKVTASKDINKIIRTRYLDDDYIAFAEKAMKAWENADPYREYYHRSSWVQVVKEGSHRSKMRGPNDKKLSIENLLGMVGSRERPKLAPDEELWLNESVGYADSDLAVEAVAKEAASQGVLRVKKDIVKLIITDKELCEGVEVEDGLSVMAGMTIMATGPWTVGLLEKSGVWFPNGFFTVTAVAVATLNLGNTDFEEMRSMPILVTENGEVMPSAKHKVLKMTTTSTFRIDRPGQVNDVGPYNINTNRAVLEKMLPQFSGRELDSWICPDLMTPYQHPLVDKAPKTRQLYLATGGSYHSFKFLPTFGDMVVRRLQGQSDSNTLEGRLLKRWGWERSEETISVHRSVIPKPIS